MKTRLAVALTIVVTGLGLASPAGAGGDTPSPGPWADGRIRNGAAEGGAGVPVGSGDGGGTGGGSGAQPNCTTSDGTPGFISYGPLLVTTQEEQRTEIRPWEQRPGGWAHQYCNGEWMDFVFLPDAAPIDPAVLAQSVFARIRPPAPALQVNPDADAAQLVNLATWLWIDPAAWTPISESDSVGTVSVTVTVAPQRLHFNMGDGVTFTCEGPGVPYDPTRPAEEQDTYCKHIYRSSSADQPDLRYPVTVTAEYSASWSSSGAIVDGGDLGTLESDATVRLRVAEGQAIVT